MKNQGQILANVGNTGSAVVAWDNLSKDGVLDALNAVLNFFEGNHKGQFAEAGLRSGRHVRLFSITKPDLAGLDTEI
jgi:hypothetical protein